MLCGCSYPQPRDSQSVGLVVLFSYRLLRGALPVAELWPCLVYPALLVFCSVVDLCSCSLPPTCCGRCSPLLSALCSCCVDIYINYCGLFYRCVVVVCLAPFLGEVLSVCSLIFTLLSVSCRSYSVGHSLRRSCCRGSYLLHRSHRGVLVHSASLVPSRPPPGARCGARTRRVGV